MADPAGTPTHSADNRAADEDRGARTMRPYSTTNAMAWAEEFMAVVGGGAVVDEGLMIAWFANAIEVGRAAGRTAGIAETSAVLGMSSAEYAPADLDGVRRTLQRIRAGWLPHHVGPADVGSWWWGRPRSGDGFFSWASGWVPSMSVVEPMEQPEIDLWCWSLHPMAQEVEA